MVSIQSQQTAGKSLSIKGRLILTSCLLPAALVVGFAASVALYQANRDSLRQSDVLGQMICGKQQHIDDVPTGRGEARKMICRDAAGMEVNAAENHVAAKFSLPFMLLFAIPSLLLAWTFGGREGQH
jgi:hypothetical protein